MLDKEALKAAIGAIFPVLQEESDAAAATDKFAELLSDAIHDYITSSTVDVTGTSNGQPFTGQGTIS